ncbi:MAG TPA: patatin-like phospholipase family protein, partial [Solirubrobacterales bacterium]|nr:patatin-like phospholipase family protein [Solirubrobacterales bacterium]
MSKLGIALSGGGFRAAFFHVGVLARLAELDLLRELEVISCVSGGSIAGALYYLRLRLLLEGNRDEEITQEDYLALVRDVEL